MQSLLHTTTQDPGRDAPSAAARSQLQPVHTFPAALQAHRPARHPEGRAPAAACRPPAPPAPRPPGPARPPRMAARSARPQRPPRPRPRRRPRRRRRRPRTATPRARLRRPWARTTCSLRRCPGCRQPVPRPRLRQHGSVRFGHRQTITLARYASTRLGITQQPKPLHRIQAFSLPENLSAALHPPLHPLNTFILWRTRTVAALHGGACAASRCAGRRSRLGFAVAVAGRAARGGTPAGAAPVSAVPPSRLAGARAVARARPWVAVAGIGATVAPATAAAIPCTHTTALC